MKLDLKDRKILYQLDLDSRQSFAQIGRKVGLARNSVSYRINRMEEGGIIQDYYTIIDCFKLGYSSLRFYLTYQYATPKIKQQILEYFMDNDLVYFIGSIEGRYDLVIIMWVNNTNDFHRFWRNTLKRFRDYLQQQVFSSYIQLLHYPNSWLLEEYDPADREHRQIIGGGSPINIDETDVKILQLMAGNARIPITDIADQLGVSTAKVLYRIDQLTESKVIQGFRTNFDINALGYKQFKVDIDFKDYNTIDSVTSYLVSVPYLYYITRTAGHSDLEPTFRVRDLRHLHEVMDRLIEKFPDAIKNYQYFYITQMNKLLYMPNIVP
jgi:DNA-binding Lrp family transcriptional regulator